MLKQDKQIDGLDVINRVVKLNFLKNCCNDSTFILTKDEVNSIPINTGFEFEEFDYSVAWESARNEY